MFDNVDFICWSNGLVIKEDVKKVYFEMLYIVNVVGWFMGLLIFNVFDLRF